MRMKIHAKGQVVIPAEMRMQLGVEVGDCLETLSRRSVDLVDAYLAALCKTRQLRGIYSFDRNLRRLGAELLPVE